MKLIAAVLCATAICSAGLFAQTAEKTTTTKVKIEDGKSVTVTGCVAPVAGGAGFMLTNVADKKGALHDYTLVSDHDLSKHVGQRLEIKGVVTDRGDANVTIETKTKTTVEDETAKETHTKSELKGDLSPAYLGVKSMKTIAAVCP